MTNNKRNIKRRIKRKIRKRRLFGKVIIRQIGEEKRKEEKPNAGKLKNHREVRGDFIQL